MEDKVKKYIKNPVCIEAVQWTGYNSEEIKRFVGDCVKFENRISSNNDSVFVSHTMLVIHTLEGNMRADIGDFIIRGIKGECYPCKPDIFHETYHEV